jgi:hypothetical protein
MSSEGTGRRILLAVGLLMIVVAGILGFVVGSNGGAGRATITVFGALALPATPGAMALYGIVLAAVVEGALFSAVEYASRVEGRRT